MELKQKFFINSHKGVTFLAILVMIAYFGRWSSQTAWVYLAIHGTYGLLWVAKSRLYPDRAWEQPCSLAYGIFVIWGALTLYWLPPLFLTWQGVEVPAWYLALCVSIYSFGLFFHFVGDMQKYTAMKLSPGILITDSVMSLSRNINYFGEMLIYLAFGLLAYTPWALLPLLLFMIFYWIPNMRRKEKSLSQKDGFQDYKRKTRAFFPFIF
jgi:steroid 5-alpha reductase family enzyme